MQAFSRGKAARRKHGDVHADLRERDEAAVAADEADGDGTKRQKGDEAAGATGETKP